MSRQYAAYRNAQASTVSSRQTEADVFLRLNFALNKALKDRDNIALAKALADIRRYWYFLIGCVEDPTNPLPLDLKTSIVGIGRAVIREIDASKVRKALDVNFILSVNQNCAEGLSGPSTPAPSPKAPVEGMEPLQA